MKLFGMPVILDEKMPPDRAALGTVKPRSIEISEHGAAIIYDFTPQVWIVNIGGSTDEGRRG